MIVHIMYMSYQLLVPSVLLDTENDRIFGF